MQYQYVIDNAESLSFDYAKAVATTTARDGTVRAVSRGAQPWVITAQLPTGNIYQNHRGFIAKMAALDKITPSIIQVNNVGQLYLVQYQGNANPNNMTGSWTTGDTFTITSGGAASGFNFKAGDYVQLAATGSVYLVVEDCPAVISTVRVHRPIIDPAGSGQLLIGQNCRWNVIAIDVPKVDIIERGQMSWSGAFIFSENLVR